MYVLDIILIGIYNRSVFYANSGGKGVREKLTLFFCEQKLIIKNTEIYLVFFL